MTNILLHSSPCTDNEFMHETRRREVFTKLRVIKIFTWWNLRVQTYAVHTAQPQHGGEAATLMKLIAAGNWSSAFCVYV